MQNIKRTHKQSVTLLIIACYISMMLLFAITRAFGLLWFKIPPVNITISDVASHVIMSLFWIFDGVATLKTLSSVPIKHSILYISLARILVYMLYYINPSLTVIIEIICIVVIPFYFNEDKRRSIGYSLFYIVSITLYSGVMMLGRGYPLIAKFSPIWQIISIIDYHMFVLGLVLMKGAFSMFPPGCWLLFGKFDDLARKIGGFILKPVERFLKDEN